MEFSLLSGHILEQKTDCLILPLAEKRPLRGTLQKLDEQSRGYFSRLIKSGDLSGKLGQTHLLHHIPGIRTKRVLLAGHGETTTLSHGDLQEMISASLVALQSTSAKHILLCTENLQIDTLPDTQTAKYAWLAIDDHIYRYDTLQSKTSEKTPVQHLSFHCTPRKRKAVTQGITEAQAIAEGIRLSKNLTNAPPNLCTPATLEQTAYAIAQRFDTTTCHVLDAKMLQQEGLAALHAVGRASVEAPRLIILRHQGASKNKAPIVFVGKGVTFDSGGLSLKTPTSMRSMKFDMCGAATALATLQIAAQLNLPLNVMAVVPAVENMPDGSAYRPDDVLTSLSGQTIEVTNTDAEGRLILCDALTYCRRFKPKVVIDIATLTGAIIITLGHHATGLFSNHQKLSHELQTAGEISGDRAWPLPIWEVYQSSLESNVADMVNAPGREAGSITAACFLSRFTEGLPWAHLDIAGSAYSTGKKAQATGRPIRLLAQYLLSR